MEDPKEIERERFWCATLSNDELISVIHASVTFSARHIAARQVQEERRRKAEEARHEAIEEKLAELGQPSTVEKWTLRFVIGTFIVAVLSLFIAWLAWRKPMTQESFPVKHHAAP